MFEPEFDPNPLPDGVYIGLDATPYFAQPRLGSSDLMKLGKHKEGWWWQSRWNPDRATDQTEAMNYGSALHALILEGMAAYQDRFAVEPDPKDFPGLLTTAKAVKAAITAANIKIQGSSDFLAQDWNDAAAIHLPGRHVWENIYADFNRTREIRDAAGEVVALRPVISAVEDRMLRVMYDAALEDEDVRALLGADQPYPTLAELSFFWTDRWGNRRRARFDKPVPSYTLDLKSLGNWQGRSLEHHVGDVILKDHLDCQLGDQHDARKLMHAMVRDLGDACIYGGTHEERAWLKAIAERDLPFHFVWLFYQKPELTGRAPVVFPVVEPWRGPYHVSGFRRARHAIRTYMDCIDRFGLGPLPAANGRPARPWSRIERPHWTVAREGEHYMAPENRTPIITLPHFGWDEVPVDDEEEHFMGART